MEHTTEILLDKGGMEFQFLVTEKLFKIRIHKERRFDSVNYDCFSMKRQGTMSFSKLYNSNGHFVNLTPARVLEILDTMPSTEKTIELRNLALYMSEKK